MCALRHYRSIQPVSLANQYRLEMKPKRPEPRRLIRPKKRGGVVQVEGDQQGNKGPEMAEVTPSDQRLSLAMVDDLDDFDFEDDDDYLDPPSPVIQDLAQRYYLQACEELKVMPIKCIHDGLVKISLKCKNATMQHKDVKACTIALLGNSMVESVHFSNNDMGPEGGRYLGDMLARNCYLADVTVVWNNLSSLGAESICKALSKNNTVKKLDLTGNGFKETDAVFFRELLEENITIQELYLGHNYFREDGGELLAAGLLQNDTVIVLDLSWNHLRLKGAMAIGLALQKNLGVEKLNISWNGLHMEGMSMLGQALTRNSTLLELDISCNRIMDICLPQFLAGLKSNTTLKKLIMSKNHITNTGAMTILHLLKDNPSIALDYIDFGDQNVKEEFVALIDDLKKTGKDIQIKHGHVWSSERDPIGKDDQTEDEIALLNENPHFVLMEFMRLQKLRLVDLFHQMDKDNSRGISVDEFKTGLEAVDIPLKRKTLEKFVKGCDSDNNGEIDFSELMEANRQYKAHLRNQVKTKEPIEKSSVGRIQKLLRKIMISNGTLRHCVPPKQVTNETEKPASAKATTTTTAKTTPTSAAKTAN